MQIRPFQLSLGVDDEQQYVLYIYTDVHNLVLPIDVPERIFSIGARLLEADGPVFYDDPHELGRELGAILYPAAVQQQLAAAAERALRTKDRIQIHIQIAVPELAALPWEWAIIPTPQPWAPARSDDYPVVRLSAAALGTPPAIAVDGPLRILVCVNDADVDTVQTIHALLADEIRQQRIAVDICSVSSAIDLELALQQQQYHVVHCMTAVALDSERALVLRYDHDIDSDEFRALLAPYPCIGMLAITPVGQPTAEILAYPQIFAALMLGSTLPVALSCSGVLTASAATRFAATFYNAVSSGTAIDSALSHARRSLSHFDVDTIRGYPQLRMIPGSAQVFAFPPAPDRRDWLRAVGTLLLVIVALITVVVAGRWLRGDMLPPFLRTLLP